MTAYDIKTTGLAKVSGKHLSLAPNAESFEQIEREANEEARAILRGEHDEHKERSDAKN